MKNKCSNYFRIFAYYILKWSMAFRFNLFSTPQHHRVFNYQPVFYDPEKERLKEKLKKVTAERELKEAQEAELNEPSKDYAPGSLIYGSLRDGAYKRTKSEGGALLRIAKYVMFLALAGLLYYFAKYFILMMA